MAVQVQYEPIWSLYQFKYSDVIKANIHTQAESDMFWIELATSHSQLLIRAIGQPIALQDLVFV